MSGNSNKRASSGGFDGPGAGAPVVVDTEVVVTVAVVVKGTVIVLVYVLGGWSPSGASGLPLSLCMDPMNKPMKMELRRRRTRRRTSSILLMVVSGF
jgi:hypothetical protein